MMKRAIGLLLLAACCFTPGCDTLDALRIDGNSEFQSSGPADGDELIGFMAISANPLFSSDEGVTDSDPLVPQVRRFAETFAAKFSADFPDQLYARGVATHTAGRGVPLLRVSVAAYRKDCGGSDRGECHTQAQVRGALLDTGGKRIWSFTNWVTIDYMDAKAYQAFYKQLLDSMAKDQAIPR